MKNKMEKSSSGIGLFSLLGLVFIVLKLTEVIDWSWWWVTLPLWGGVAIVLLIVLLVLIAIGVIAFIISR